MHHGLLPACQHTCLLLDVPVSSVSRTVHEADESFGRVGCVVALDVRGVLCAKAGGAANTDMESISYIVPHAI